MSQGTLLTNGEDFTQSELWQEYYIDPKDPVLRKQIYFSTEPVPNHVHIFEDNNLIPALEEWGDEIEHRLSEDYLNSCQLFWHEEATEADGNVIAAKVGRRRVFARLRMNVDGQNVKLSFDVAEASFRPYSHGQLRSAYCV